MATVIARLYKLEYNYTYEDENQTSSLTFGSLLGAQEYAKKHKSEMRWYSIEGLDYIPCNENDPDGQLYMGMIHFEYHDVIKDEQDEA